MREFLFRGKRKDNGEWVEGYLLMGRPYSCDNEEVNIVPPTDPMFFPRCEIGMHYEVDPETVGQYIGSTDRNGKKIFEGDIVSNCIGEYYDDEISVIGYESASFYYRTLEEIAKNISGTAIDDIDYGIHTDGCTVIGNIHDNPELLEVK